jgi:hypothetical protein
MKHILISSIILGAVLLALPFSSSTAQAKKLPTVTTYSTNYHKVKFNYTSRATKSFNINKGFTDQDNTMGMTLTKIAYYKLKPKYNKRILVRAYFHVTTTNADDLSLFQYNTDPRPYLNTSNGDRIYQSGAKDLSYGILQMNGKDVANTHVDFIGKKAISFGNFSSGAIHFYYDYNDISEFPFS